MVRSKSDYETEQPEGEHRHGQEQKQDIAQERENKRHRKPRSDEVKHH